MSKSYIDRELESHLAIKMEGKVYANIWITYCFGTFIINKDYYRVENGKILHIHPKGHNQSGDTFLGTHSECHLVGKFDAKKEYKMVRREMTYSEIVKALKLK